MIGSVSPATTGTAETLKAIRVINRALFNVAMLCLLLG